MKKELEVYGVVRMRDVQISPSFAAWMSLPMIDLGESYHVDGMDKFHGSNIEVHLVFL